MAQAYENRTLGRVDELFPSLDPDGTIGVVYKRSGNYVTATLTLTATVVTVTDAAGSGSYGTATLWVLPAATRMHVLSVVQDYTAFAEGAALTGAAGDASFDIGVGSVAIAAADGALATTDDDIGSEVNITLSGGTGTGTGTSALGFITAAAGTMTLNWSGTAATIDASSTINVTGTIKIVGVMIE